MSAICWCHLWEFHSIFDIPRERRHLSFHWIYCLTFVWNLFAEQYAYFSQSLHFRKYGATFTVRNALIVLSVTWFSTSLPLTKAGRYFKLDQRTFDCTALNNQDSYRIYILISTFFLCFPPFSYCYIGIAR